jgi:ATP-dependent Clp protease ATP-binding subunit ClpB
VIFHALDLDRIKEIVRIQLVKLTKMVADRGLALEVTESAIEALAREGYDPAFGARPLKRAIQKEVQNPLAMKLLEGTFPTGTKVTVDYEAGGFTFAGAAPAAKAAKAEKPKGKATQPAAG